MRRVLGCSLALLLSAGVVFAAPGKTTQIAPSGVVPERRPEFSWTAVTGATWYSAKVAWLRFSGLRRSETCLMICKQMGCPWVVRRQGKT